ncbi:MAG TPA: YbfB/YjiJ family MFS transporter [Ramlibacter sp.]|nr:YbfB/YjiJ family MFS transporter [Ramlibacter sp.]
MTNARPPATALVVLAGLLSLAAAMGIGRFAFTPVLPLMAREGQLALAFGGWLAAANYAGYFAGALTAARLPLDARRLAVVALLSTAVLTAAMAWRSPAAWLLLRFAAGMASAWVFVATSVWCLGELARRGSAGPGGWVYAGVGGGIALTGLYCLVAPAAGVRASALWLHLGALALVLMLPVAWVIARLPSAAAGNGGSAPAAPAMDGETRGLVLCYGLMGFGYILPATFLPALARGVVDDPARFGLAWPVFGAMAAASTVLAARIGRHATRLQVWSASQLLMGAGVLLPSLWVNAATLAASALLVGGTFMVITLAGVQEMRARAPAHAPRFVGRITAAFALGQIAGPVTSALLLQVPALGPRALSLSLQLAAFVLLASGAWLWRRASRNSNPETVHA